MPKKNGDGRDFELAAKIIGFHRDGLSHTEIAKTIKPSLKDETRRSLESERSAIKRVIKKSQRAFTDAPKNGKLRCLAEHYENELNALIVAELCQRQLKKTEYEAIDKERWLHMADPDGNGARPMSKKELLDSIDRVTKEAIAAIAKEQK